MFPHGEQEERGNKAVTVEGYKIVHKNDIVVNIILAWMGAIGISEYDGVTSPAYGTVRQRSIKSICYEDDTYELTTVDGAVCNENTFEKMFGQLENIYEPFITELISTLDSNKSLKSFLIRDKNRESLIMFMVSMLLRNPIVFGQTQEAGRKCGIEWTKAQSRNNAILHNASLLEGWSKKLHKTHKIVVLKNKSDVDFVTGSFPCSIMSTDENGDTTRGTLVLSPRYMVLLIDKKIREFKEDSVVPVNTFVVDEYNAMVKV